MSDRSLHVAGAGYAPGRDHAKIHIRFDQGTRMLCGVLERHAPHASWWSVEQVSRMIQTGHPFLCRHCLRITRREAA